MNNTKLILVEGLPGSGKTSTARFVKQLLDEQNIANRLFLEGDLEHPADYDFAAYFTEEQYKQMLQKYTEQQQLIIKHSETKADGYIVYYGKLLKETDSINSEYFGDYDVYNLPLERHQQLIIEKWSDLSRQAINGDEVYILECCFLQNPLTVMLVRDNCSEVEISTYIHELNRLIKQLNPVLLYLYQDDFKHAFPAIIAERPTEWLNFITWYYTEQGYGKSRGLNGTQGLLEVLELRKAYELAILNELPIDKMLFNKSSLDWDKIHSQIQIDLQNRLSR
ncbi:hypothetical protein MHH56_26485 [Paenibacillus sp. FSL K6-3182]|uniref:hypothetical protein n=1 Tax=Paenibacillus sp. FSL K6-3182 TaxID=2921495 RepID=UPI0030D36D1C